MSAYSAFEPQVGEILALRTFRIGSDGGLFPLFTDRAWSDGPNTAACRVPAPVSADSEDRLPAHVAPEPDCSCGYYAYADEDVANDYPGARHVLAVVACWGRVIAGTRGLRSQHASIEAVWLSARVPVELSDAVGARYPHTSIYTDKSLMLAAHPVTPLASYEVSPSRLGPGWPLRLLIALACVVALLPTRWLGPVGDGPTVWSIEVGAFLAGAVTLCIVRRERLTGGLLLLIAAVTAWLVAPLAGIATTWLLRVAILFVAALGRLYVAQLRHEAGRFPTFPTAPKRTPGRKLGPKRRRFAPLWVAKTRF